MRERFEGRGKVDQRRIQVRDTETGTELDLMVTAPRVPHPYERWCAMNQTKLFQIASDPELTPCALRLLLILMADLEGGNVFRLSQGEAGRLLGYTRRQINRAWKQLREAELIQEVEDRGYGAWGLAPEVVWRGKARGLRQILRERQDAKRAQAKRENSAETTEHISIKNSVD